MSTKLQLLNDYRHPEIEQPISEALREYLQEVMRVN